MGESDLFGLFPHVDDNGRLAEVSHLSSLDGIELVKVGRTRADLRFLIIIVVLVHTSQRWFDLVNELLIHNKIFAVLALLANNDFIQ